MHDRAGAARVNRAQLWPVRGIESCTIHVPGPMKAGNSSFALLLLHAQLVEKVLLVEAPILRDIVELAAP